MTMGSPEGASASSSSPAPVAGVVSSPAVVAGPPAVVSGAAVVADPPPPPQAARIMARAAKSAITRFICLLLAFSAPPVATVCDAGAHYRNRLKLETRQGFTDKTSSCSRPALSPLPSGGRGDGDGGYLQTQPRVSGQRLHLDGGAGGDVTAEPAALVGVDHVLVRAHVGEEPVEDDDVAAPAPGRLQRQVQVPEQPLHLALDVGRDGIELLRPVRMVVIGR